MSEHCRMLGQPQNSDLHDSGRCLHAGLRFLRCNEWQAHGTGPRRAHEQVVHERNRQKARLLYEAIDGSGGFYRGHAQKDCRSLMNVTFRLPSEALERTSLKRAKIATSTA